jgi:hypothetical protein
VRRLVTAGVMAALALAATIPAVASTGVSIDVGRIAVSERLLAGGEYRLPVFGVGNPGTETASYVMSVSYLDQAGLRPQASWLQFAPSAVTLAPGESAVVATRLQLPPVTEPGDYLALIGPEIASGAEGPRVGAAAAARLTFSVAPSSWLEGLLRWLWRLLLEHLWIVLLVLALAVLLGIRHLRRRFAFSVVRRT